MIYIEDDFVVREEAKILLSKNQVVYKVKSPIFGLHDYKGVPFQPKLAGYGGWSSDEAVVVFPMIPQYFHNFFELFNKMLHLRDAGEVFKAVIVHPEWRIDGKFKSLIKAEDATFNACHMREFLEWANIDYICLTPDELVQSKFGYTYLFFMDTCCEDEASITIRGKRYEMSHFLKVPNNPVLLEGVEHLRRYFPTEGAKEKLPIFISRKKAWDRKFPHEEALEKLMMDLGYTVALFEDMSWLDQIRLVQNASHIVCEYGSALVNCSLTTPKTKVLSINHVPGYHIPTYKYIMAHYGIPHFALSIRHDNNPLSLIEEAIRGTMDFTQPL